MDKIERSAATYPVNEEGMWQLTNNSDDNKYTWDCRNQQTKTSSAKIELKWSMPEERIPHSPLKKNAERPLVIQAEHAQDAWHGLGAGIMFVSYRLHGCITEHKSFMKFPLTI